MQIPPEALTSLGYILGGLILVAIMRRGDIEKTVDSTLGAKPKAAPPASIPLTLLPQPSAGLLLDDTNQRMATTLLERLSRDLDREREYNREQFARMWDEITALKRNQPPIAS